MSCSRAFNWILKGELEFLFFYFLALDPILSLTQLNGMSFKTMVMITIMTLLQLFKNFEGKKLLFKL